MLTLRQENPQNFSPLRKWTVTVMLGLMTIPVAFTSSVFGTAMQPTSRQFGVSQEVMVLGTSLFVLGFSFGPSIFGPLSELYGRKMPLFVGFFIFAVFRITVAVAQNLQTIFVRRFLGGVFSSGPLAIIYSALSTVQLLSRYSQQVPSLASWPALLSAASLPCRIFGCRWTE
ncbi:uncharacterized protein ACHE_31400A [Aspergillus chevalieri]|uniref:Major facilitator superfamily (MFS) profile domain-containing protein n=1 Tax=Aspergillus chevalieri TaxID=182096 RepID=A0A7R7VNW5_ASPCH|nr:uncharacterized protein ACHE_31400A [Aspergillus chevalieri]BCR87413.1 hypothetical protein ACHE_31400A [Aspergillus chevalieri]